MSNSEYEIEFFAELREVPNNYLALLPLSLRRVACPACNKDYRLTEGDPSVMVTLRYVPYCPVCYGRGKIWSVEVPVGHGEQNG